MSPQQLVSMFDGAEKTRLSGEKMRAISDLADAAVEMAERLHHLAYKVPADQLAVVPAEVWYLAGRVRGLALIADWTTAGRVPAGHVADGKERGAK